MKISPWSSPPPRGCSSPANYRTPWWRTWLSSSFWNRVAAQASRMTCHPCWWCSTKCQTPFNEKIITLLWYFDSCCSKVQRFFFLLQHLLIDSKLYEWVKCHSLGKSDEVCSKLCLFLKRSNIHEKEAGNGPLKTLKGLVTITTTKITSIFASSLYSPSFPFDT